MSNPTDFTVILKRYDSTEIAIMINLWPIGIAVLGAGAFSIIAALALNIWADWPAKRIKSPWRPQPLDDWRDLQ